MSAVMIELTPPPAPTLEDDAVVLVDDVEELSAFNRCSCAVGDDQPY
ncbi:MAG: hypothetical protein ACR2GH_03400 [Pseudonocardia sp.]